MRDGYPCQIDPLTDRLGRAQLVTGRLRRTDDLFLVHMALKV
jgi:hypothetical protein